MSLFQQKSTSNISLKSTVSFNPFQISEGIFVIEYDDGTKYKGEMSDSKKSGFGVIKYPNGEYYEGEFVNDEFEGKGRFVSSEMTYEGYWKQGYADGQGKEIWKSGAVFEGTFVFGVKRGEGSYVWENGNSYKGTWQNDKMNGEGIYRFSNGIVLKGTFENGVLKGRPQLISGSDRNVKSIKNILSNE